MRFGRTLRQSVYEPWKDQYIDYDKLKTLLREDAASKDADAEEPWTAEDETRFCEEIFNVQLVKVAGFQAEKFRSLKERIDAAFAQLRDMAPTAAAAHAAAASAGVVVAGPAAGETSEAGKQPAAVAADRLRSLEAELDAITNEVRELKRYSNLNYTGFLKIAKKHDRRRGEAYRILPLTRLSLAREELNSERAYAPLLQKLGLMYFVIRHGLESKDGAAEPPRLLTDLESSSKTHNGEKYTAYKLWIHPDNLLEVQTIILRHLPALLYSERSAKELDGTADPTITSLYFDNAKFGLYMKKVEHQVEAPSLRLRWYGQLSSRPELYMERKVVHENGVSEERKFTLKDKYVKPFLDGDYHMEKTVDKMARQGRSEAEIASFKETVASIQDFIKKNSLEPVLRANYRRMAYQNPADDRVRISIDTDIAFVREDTLDSSRPCRDPASWHRTDIDNANMSFPFSNINRSEVSKFPYAVLEIKLRESHSHKRPAWIEELMGGHLVYAAPRFSKFVHGVASLFEDYVNSLPLWLNDLASDITRDPEAAYREDAARRAARAEEDMVVGSFIGGSKASRSLQHLPPGKASPVAKSYPSTTGVPGELAASSAAQGARARSVDASILASEAAAAARSQRRGEVDGAGEEGSGIGQRKEQQQQRQRGVGGAFGYGTISSFIPAFSLSRYSQAMRRRAEAKSGGVRVELPEGVVEPSSWLKNEGPLKIEPKAWLANERTSLKWLHIVMLLGALATALFVSAGEDTIAAAMGIACLGIAIFAGSWSFYMHDVRRRMIIERSGKDFDNPVGPLVVSGALMVALILNLVFQYKAAFERMHHNQEPSPNFSADAAWEPVGEL